MMCFFEAKNWLLEYYLNVLSSKWFIYYKTVIMCGVKDRNCGSGEKQGTGSCFKLMLVLNVVCFFWVILQRL
jgi:hypothetical protein